MSLRLRHEGIRINAFEDGSGTRAGTGETSHESLSTSSGSSRCSTDFNLPSLMKESRRNADKLHLAAQSLTLNTFRDPAGRALVESVKAILSGDADSRLSGGCRNVAQESSQRQSSSFDGHVDELSCNQQRSCKTDVRSQITLDHRQQDLSPPHSSEATLEESEESQAVCNPAMQMDAHVFHSEDAREKTQLSAHLPGASCSSLAMGTSTQCGGQQLNPSDVNMHDWQVWASHVSELLSTFSNELVSLGSRVDQMCSNFAAPPAVSSTLPCIMEETHVEDTSIVSESEQTAEPSKMCEVYHEACEQRFATLSSRLDNIEQSLRNHDFTERARRCSRIGDVSFESDCTAPGDNFMEMPVSTSRAASACQEGQQVCSLRPLDSLGADQSEQIARHEVHPLSQVGPNIDDDAYKASIRTVSTAGRQSSHGPCPLACTKNDVVKLDFALRPERRCMVENAGTPALHNDDLSRTRAQQRIVQRTSDIVQRSKTPEGFRELSFA